jgi:hypothetical protein
MREEAEEWVETRCSPFDSSGQPWPSAPQWHPVQPWKEFLTNGAESDSRTAQAIYPKPSTPSHLQWIVKQESSGVQPALRSDRFLTTTDSDDSAHVPPLAPRPPHSPPTRSGPPPPPLPATGFKCPSPHRRLHLPASEQPPSRRGTVLPPH